MKRIILLLVLLCALQVFAYASSPKIVDDAGLLTSDQLHALDTKAQAIVEEYQTDVVIVTVPTTSGKDAQDFADDYFDYNGYGIGADHSGILLLLVMDTREWVISTTGRTMELVSRSDADDLFYSISDILRDDYYEGFNAYLDHLPDYLAEEELSIGSVLLIAVVIGAAVGGITLLIMRSSMNTSRQQRGAVTYVTDGSYKLTQHLDFYLYSNTVRRKRESNNSGSHRGSSGRSHGGSRGHF